MSIAYRLGVIATIMVFPLLALTTRPSTLRPRLRWSTNASNANTGGS